MAAAPLNISQLETADDLVNRLKNLQRQRTTLENKWKVNLAFYKGNQYTYYNRYSRRIEQLPVEDGDKPRFRQRMVSNQLVPGCNSLLSKYTKSKPVMLATPGTSDDKDLQAATVADSLLEQLWNTHGLDDRLQEVLIWTMCAQGWWWIDWDAQAGTPMTFTLDPQGNPITNPELISLYHEHLTQQGIDPQMVQQTVYQGDIRVSVPSPFDVYVDPTKRMMADIEWAFVCRTYGPDEVKLRWGVDVQADAISWDNDIQLPGGTAVTSGDKNVRRVWTLHVKPSPTSPQGRCVSFIEGPNTILEDGPWVYPSPVMPLIHFPGVRIPGSVYHSTVVEQAIPLQKELNRILSQIMEYKNMTIRPRIWAPIGSLRTRLTNEPGAVYEYAPIGGLKPETEQIPSLPSYVFEMLQDVQNRIREVFSATEVSEGKLPPNLEAGYAIDLLQEMSADRIAPSIRLMENAIAKAGQQMLELAQKYYSEPRILKIKGTNGSSQVKQFTRADITGDVQVRVEAGSSLPRTRAGRALRVERMIEMQLISPQMGMKYLDTADLKGALSNVSSDEDQAYREHEKISMQYPLNVIAMQNAHDMIAQQIQQGMAPTDPTNGQPFQNPQQIESFLHDASLSPTEFEDWKTHVEIHGLFMKSASFEQLPLEIQQDYVTHFSKTREKLFSIPRLPDKVNSPNVNLQIKSTAGPTAVAGILNKAGIFDVTPETMLEPPLETWISDSVDKPDDPNANTAIAENERAQQAHEQEMAGNAQDMAHQQEMHQAKLAQAKAPKKG